MRHHLDLDFDASAVDGLSFSSRLTSPVHIRKGRFLFFASHHCPFSSSPRRAAAAAGHPFYFLPSSTTHTQTTSSSSIERTPAVSRLLPRPKVLLLGDEETFTIVVRPRREKKSG